MSYAELADRLGIAVKSAKNARPALPLADAFTGNDGKTLVQVPIDVHQSRRP